MARTDRHLVVDGSNIATEGRTLPSLKQLDEAVRAITTDFPYSSLTVIVDATFAHRIDESERPEFEAAVLAGEIVTPPAGAVGRGDAFILQVADKAKAVVLSNDSFQEFHGEHDWLFEEGRLIGGKPIEGIGWVFVERVPVRGPASRRAIRVASEGGRVSSRGGRSRSRSRSSSSSPSSAAAASTASAAASGPPPVPGPANPPPRKRAEVTTPLGSVARRGRGRKAEAEAEAEAEAANDQGAAAKADATAAPAATASKRFEELNDPRSFMSFVSRYSIGDEVEAVVDQFSSHGCYLRAASARCYLPCRAMGDPPPTRARDIVAQGQSIIVKVESLDADRRGINVALVRAVPVDGESKESKQPRDPQPAARRVRNPAKPPQPPSEGPEGTDEGASAATGQESEGTLTRSTTNVATTKPAKKTAAKKSTATGAKKAAKATPSARATKAAAKKTTAKKAVAKKATAKKATTTKKAVKKAVAKKTTAKKAPAKKAPAKKAAAKKA